MTPPLHYLQHTQDLLMPKPASSSPGGIGQPAVCRVTKEKKEKLVNRKRESDKRKKEAADVIT